MKEIIKKIRERVAQSPDNVYRPDGGVGCYYDKHPCTDGTVGCLFGQVMLSDYPNMRNFGSITSVVCHYTIPHSEQELNWCDKVQSLQDIGTKWSECIELADKEYPLED